MDWLHVLHMLVIIMQVLAWYLGVGLLFAAVFLGVMAYERYVKKIHDQKAPLGIAIAMISIVLWPLWLWWGPRIIREEVLIRREDAQRRKQRPF